MGSAPDEVAAILASFGNGDPDAAARLLPFVYEELRVSARKLMRGESQAHTLQPTAVVHEAFLRLINAKVDCKERADFCRLAAWEMRRVLVDHARRRDRLKRGGEHDRVQLDERVAVAAQRDVGQHDVDLHEALVKIAAKDERAARVVELRFLGGLSVEETARLLGVSDRTVENDWRLASAWLKRELSTQDGPS